MASETFCYILLNLRPVDRILLRFGLTFCYIPQILIENKYDTNIICVSDEIIKTTTKYNHVWTK